MLIFLLKESIPRIVLQPPAELALKSLQALCLDSDSFILDHLNADGKTLLNNCSDLKINRYCHEDRARLNTNPVLSEHIRQVSKQINYDNLAKLAILTWNFDASSQLPPEQLFHFLAHPHDKDDSLYLNLRTSYSNLTGNYSTEQQFKQEVTELLSLLGKRMEGDWNVMQKCMSLEQPTSTLLKEIENDQEQGSGNNCNDNQNSAVTGPESIQAQDTKQLH